MASNTVESQANARQRLPDVRPDMFECYCATSYECGSSSSYACFDSWCISKPHCGPFGTDYCIGKCKSTGL